MREIKYKAYWHDSKLMTLVDTIEFLQGGTRVSDGCVHTGWAGKDCELIQYTGLKDKNGVEIYEGDLVEHEDDIDGYWELYEACEIIYSTEVHGFCFRLDEGNSLSGYRNFEVVGNRYENTELLEGNK